MKDARDTQPILFVGGESGGHIVPLVAVMQALQELDPQVPLVYVGTAKDLGSPLVKDLPYPKYAISSGKLHRYATWKHVGEMGKLAAGMFQAPLLIQKLRPKVILSKGGSVSVPVVTSAAARHIPICTHETDVIPGLANRLSSRFAQTIFTAFPAEDYPTLPLDKIKAYGQPVREVFFKATKSEHLSIDGVQIISHLPIITVIAGSQGGHQLNKLVCGSWDQVLPQCKMVHISGANDYEWLCSERSKLPPELQGNLVVTPFVFKELPELFASSTVIISRSGGTIHEIAASRKPSILLPLSTAAQNHQWANAKVLEKQQAAIILDEEKVSSEVLGQTVLRLVGDIEQQGRLAERIGALAKPEAARNMAKELLRIYGRE